MKQNSCSNYSNEQA